MLSKGEAAALLSLRNSHHGNAQWDDLQLDAFRSELNPGISADEAREAMRRFYASDHDGRWCGSGDINAIVRRMRNEAKPSEAQIARECEARGLSADEAWMYRRQRMLGNGPEQAPLLALTMRNPLELPAAQPKSRSTARRFAGAQKLGAASLGSILRGA